LLVLGVDPGTVVTGWGVVECDGPRLSRVASGTLRVGRGDVAGRLARIYAGLSAIIVEHAPRVLSLERNFLARNVQSAFRLGEARGVAMAAAAAADVSLCEYTPATIKKSVAGHGRADKAQMKAAVARLFALTAELAEDEADALAAAACHGFRHGYDDKVAAAIARADGTGSPAVRRPRTRRRA